VRGTHDQGEKKRQATAEKKIVYTRKDPLGRERGKERVGGADRVPASKGEKKRPPPR